MKIAIAICGQVRPYPAPLKKLEKISQSIFADIFISTWNTSGESHKKNDDFRDKTNEKDALRFFNGIRKNDKFSGQFKDSYIDEIDKVIRPHYVAAKEPIHSKYNIPSNYLMYKALGLIKQQELKSKKRYKIIIKTRPDLLLNVTSLAYFVASLMLSGKRILSENEMLDNRIQFSDKFAIGFRKEMEIYMKIFKQMDRYWGDEKVFRENPVVGERLFKKYVSDEKLKHGYFRSFSKLMR